MNTEKFSHIGFIDRKGGKVVYNLLKDRTDPLKPRTYTSTPEEEIRFLLVSRLIEEYGYLPEQIDLEVEIQAGQKTLPKRADIVLFRNGRIKDPHSGAYIICEVKNKDKKDGIEQLETYMNNTTAEFGIWWNGTDIVYLRRLREPHRFEEIPDIPRKGETLEDVGTWDKKDLKPATELTKVFDTIHNHIYANEGLLKEKVFNEMLKFIFMKMIDEKLPDEKPNSRITSKELAEVNEGEGNSFRERIQTLWQRVKKEYGDVFDENEQINLRLTTQAFIVSQLQKYSFTRSPADVKGVAFQTFVYAHQRGERGEFFTPHPVVEMMVKMLDPSDGESIIDPAVGSAGLLVKAMLHVWEKIDKAKHLNKLEKKERKYTFARYYTRGIDINPDLAKVAKMHMVVYDDGHTGVFCANSLVDFNELHNIAVQWGAIPGREQLREKFNVLLTNPPFGSKGRVTDKKILQQFDLGYKWKKDKKTGNWIKTDKLLGGQTPEILFIERSLQFLRPYGRMAVVLPDGILSNSSLEYIRRWIMEKARVLAVVSLPPQTFIPFGSGPKASVLFLQRLPREELEKLKKEGYESFFSSVKKIGYDVRGRETYKRDERGEGIKENGKPQIDTDIPFVVEAFKAFRIKKKLIFDSLSQQVLKEPKREEIEQCDFFEISLKDFDGRLDVLHYDRESMKVLRDLTKLNSESLKRYAKVVSGPFGSSLHATSYVKDGVPFIRPSNIKNLFPEQSNLVYITKEDHSRLKSSQLKGGDVVLYKIGAGIGTIGLIPLEERYREVNISENMIGIKAKNRNFSAYLPIFLMSKYGKLQISRQQSIQAQPKINVKDIEEILIPVLRKDFIRGIDELTKDAYSLRNQAEQKYKESEELLYKALGVAKLEIEEELTYTANSKEVESSGTFRFDADFYRPKYSKILILVEDGKNLQDVAYISEETIAPTQNPRSTFEYVSLRSINGLTGEIEEIEKFSGWQAPSRAKMLVKAKDVLASSLKGSLDKVGYVPGDLDNAIASTGLFVVREKNKDCPAELLFLLFRTPILTLQMEKLASGAIIEAVSKTAFRKLRIPVVKHKELVPSIVELIREHFDLLKRSKRVVRQAIGKVENEIERLVQNAPATKS